MLPKIDKNAELKQLDALNLTETDLINYLTDFFKHTKEKDAYFFLCESKTNKDPKADKPWIQKPWRVDELNKVVPEMFSTDMTDIYLSTSVHNSKRRTEETVSSIPALVLDLDYYKTDYKHLDFIEFIQVLEKQVFATKLIPRPNYVISSGSGAYLVYNLKYTPRVVLPKRRVVMKIFYELLKDYGADAKTLDPSHIFRIPYTYNGKRGEKNMVKAYVSESVGDYTMAEIARSLPNLYDIWKKEKRVKPNPEKKPNPAKSGRIVPLHKQKTLAFSYIQNVFKLAKLREGDCDGIREMMCFLVRNYYHWMHKDRFEAKDVSLFEESLKVAYELNDLFSSPLKETEIRSSTLNKDKLYRFKVDTFNSWLGITLDEQVQLKLKTKDAKREKSKRQMRELRQSRGIAARTEYEANRKNDKEHMLDLLKRHIEKNPRTKKKDLAELLGVSAARVSQLLKEI